MTPITYLIKGDIKKIRPYLQSINLDEMRCAKDNEAAYVVIHRGEFWAITAKKKSHTKRQIHSIGNHCLIECELPRFLADCLIEKPKTKTKTL